MDTWQQQLYERTKVFSSQDFHYGQNPVKLHIGQHEAYVIVKALEDQQRYLNPTREVSE